MSDNLIGRLLRDWLAALMTMRNAHRGKQEPQVVVDFRNGPNGGTRTPRGSIMLVGNRRGKSLDGVHIRTFQSIQELPGVWRKRFNVPPLAFGIDGVECQAGLPGSAQTRDHGKTVSRNLNIDALEVVLSRSSDGNVSDVGHRM